MTSWCERYFCTMIKIQKYILMLVGICLVLLTSAVIIVDSGEMGNYAQQNCGIHNSNSLSHCVSSHNEVAEDEQLHKDNPALLSVVSVVFITGQLNSDLIFHPCSIHWEPPKA